MKTIEGDLIKLAQAGEFDVIIHGCNCFNTMGSGIAKSIRAAFPSAYEADCKTTRGDRTKLGTFSNAIVSNEKHALYIVNAYTQYKYGGPSINADYDAIKKVFQGIKQSFTGLRIGYPKIGAGLAGGDWNIIKEIIEKELEGENHTLVIFV